MAMAVCLNGGDPASLCVSGKRKRRPAGTPDPDAEVVALSPKTLMESDRYVCEICNQGFQRDQNLQMHRRRHKVPWKLLKRPPSEIKKRVYVCPDVSCLHHDPCHALGDLVGIKKHFRRKHSTEKQWRCDKCSKGYAVQSDFKAHVKTCGTRGHCCVCGRVFSRVESFIEHQDSCPVAKHKSSFYQSQPSLELSIDSPNASGDALSSSVITEISLRPPAQSKPIHPTWSFQQRELQFLPPTPNSHQIHSDPSADLRLSISSPSYMKGASCMQLQVQAPAPDADLNLSLQLRSRTKSSDMTPARASEVQFWPCTKDQVQDFFIGSKKNKELIVKEDFSQFRDHWLQISPKSIRSSPFGSTRLHPYMKLHSPHRDL